ncbi:glycine--tRNA ligase subunit beta [Aerococcus kribbianus]|uniref:Glycine--tRNA ligase beta subunit n=1 Tax=Aerococcus kribbianus TaxID=2999064 RepID=A0A9X3JG65_9LACT|nr:MULTISPECIES: glycine--tRNA ligase subunit beta [unclassified Aerococcus]MCZ0716916.1 glycine--tRNA ligase subunit beta [Aerococcus sp. YH-aer221]MCZ0725204.1 glycine--tRNA ligase subunit beta [Aerococcus sp. YH-aer222]
MSENTYLFEIGLEEVPAQYVRPASQQLKNLVANFLADKRLDYDTITTYATPRRLAVKVNGLAGKQSDLSQIAKGPAQRIAQDDQGNWTKAAQGFARGQGASVDDIYFAEVKGEPYAHIKVHTPGQASELVLGELYHVIEKMTFPVSMHWGDHHFKFIRPIHWFVSLFNDQVIPFDFLSIPVGRESRGHRYLANKAVNLNHANDYVSALEEAHVLVDQDQRKELIAQQIKDLANQHDYKIDLDADLLEEVTQIVEYPTAFLGDFDPKYLELPDDVLITSMKNHQRYFYVSNQAGDLQAKFISVRNGNDKHLDAVRLGNQKVLTARLEDAWFFVNEDKKLDIDDYAKKLEKVTFHSEIGSLAEKMQRTGAIASYLYTQWQNTKIFSQLSQAQAKIKRTAEIYKFDLVTGIVDEFSELQGIMGEKYALAAGEDKEVAQAIREHYLPSGQASDLPESALGILFAVADKLDTVISFFNINRIPSGSNDPFALRRQMIGIVSILKAYQLPFDWETDLQAILAKVYSPLADRDQLSNEILSFVNDRLKQVLQGDNIHYDIIDAVLASDAKDINDKYAASQVLTKAAETADYRSIIEAWNRVLNLRVKALELGLTDAKVDPDVLSSDSEKNLYNAVNQLQEPVNAQENYDQLAELTSEIANFFDHNMVFTDDQAVRNNRLALLAQLAHFVRRLGDTNRLQIK